MVHHHRKRQAVDPKASGDLLSSSIFFKANIFLNDSIFKAESRGMKLIYRSNLVNYFFAGGVG